MAATALSFSGSRRMEAAMAEVSFSGSRRMEAALAEISVPSLRPSASVSFRPFLPLPPLRSSASVSASASASVSFRPFLPFPLAAKMEADLAEVSVPSLRPLASSSVSFRPFLPPLRSSASASGSFRPFLPLPLAAKMEGGSSTEDWIKEHKKRAEEKSFEEWLNRKMKIVFWGAIFSSISTFLTIFISFVQLYEKSGQLIELRKKFFEGLRNVLVAWWWLKP